MKKLLFSTILAFVLIAAQAGTVFAQEATPTGGTVQSVSLETDATGAVTAVLVTYTDSAGATQTVSLTLADATAQGLVSTDADGVTTVNAGVEGLPVIIPDTTTPEEEDQHPVGSALSDFFGELLGVDYDTIMDYHDDGVGFGVIARALWLSHELDGGTETFTALLDAKQSGDYGNITLADGSTPDNWGDVVKSMKKGDNLGSVKSGHADSGEGETSTSEAGQESDDPTTDSEASSEDDANDAVEHGNGNGNANGNGNGHGNGGNHGHGHGNGHGRP
jgi:hypothetical protein